MKNTISRSEKKRRLKRLRKMVADLLLFSGAEIAALPVSDSIRRELLAGRSLKGGARQRQIKYVVKLLDEEEIGKLLHHVDTVRGTAHRAKREFHELEYLRNRLLDEAVKRHEECARRGIDWEADWSGDSLEETRRLLPKVDLENVKKLTWLFARSRRRKHARELFRLLRGAKEQQRFDREEIGAQEKPNA